jgi:hypothetical protein
MVPKLIVEDAEDDYLNRRAMRGSYWHLLFCILYVAIDGSVKDPGDKEISYIEWLLP